MDDLNIHGLDANQASAMDEVDIENLLGSDLIGSGEFSQVDTDLLKLINQNQLSPTPVDTSPGYGHLNLGSPTIVGNPTIDLANLPLTDFAAPIASRELEPDPLLSNHIPQNHQQPNNMNDLMLQQQGDQQRAHLNLTIPEPSPMIDRGLQDIMANVMPIHQQQMGQNNLQRNLNIEQLEREKMQLLAKLNEIQHGAPMSSPVVMTDHMGIQQHRNEISREQLLRAYGTMHSPQQTNIQMAFGQHLLRTQPELGESQGSTQQNSNLASAVAGMSVKDPVKDPGESPLTDFLRRRKGGGGGGGASVFSSTGGASVDPFNKGRGKLSGAMDRSTETHAMIKQLGAQVRTGGKNSTSKNSSFKNGKEQFGGPSVGKGGYIFTGIYSKHASDGNLLRTSGLARSSSKTSLSKDNLLYGLRRSKGRAGSQSKEQLNRLNRKASASKLDNLRREDSFGAIPIKSRGSGVSKFKFGGSTGNLGSFSNLGSMGGLDSFARVQNAQRGGVDGGAPGRGGAANAKYQGNAQWS